MALLNSSNVATTTTLPNFQYLTSHSDEQPLPTPAINLIPKSIHDNHYGNAINNNNMNLYSYTSHVNELK